MDRDRIFVKFTISRMPAPRPASNSVADDLI
jgi:hypothetical protein